MVNIGNSDLDIYPLVLGGNTFGWTSDKDTSFAVLNEFYENGGNTVDTADVYSAWVEGNKGGESETIIGQWLKETGNRDKKIICTKVSQHSDFPGLSASNVKAAVDASLQRLNTDYIDLYYAHFDDSETPLAETIAAFNDLVSAGKIRYIGVSNYSPARLQEWLDLTKKENLVMPIALQPHYNLVHRKEFEAELQKIALESNLGVLPYFSLAAGFLTGKYRTKEDLGNSAVRRKDQVDTYFNEAGLLVVDKLAEIANKMGESIPSIALAWLRFQPGVVAPIASASKTSQLADLMQSTKVTLFKEDIDALNEVSIEL